MELSEDKVDFRFCGYTRSRNNAISNPDIVKIVDCYRAAISKQIKALDASMLYDLAAGNNHEHLKGNLYTSIKIDGINAFFIMNNGDCYFCNTPYHRIWIGLPVSFDLARVLQEKGISHAILAGELFAANIDETGVFNWDCRSTVDDIMQCQTKPCDQKDLDRIGFRATDLISMNDERWMSFEIPSGVDPLGIIDGTAKHLVPLKEGVLVHARPFSERFARLTSILPDRGRAAVVPNQILRPEHLASFFDSIVDGGHEGIIIKTSFPEHAYKVKPIQEIDAAVVGVVEDKENPDNLGSTLLAVRRPSGDFVLVGQAAVGMNMEARKELWDTVVLADDRSVHLGKDGYAFEDRFRSRSPRKAFKRQKFSLVEPSVVVQVRTLDIRSRDRDGLPIMKPIIRYDPLEHRWSMVAKEKTHALGTAWFTTGQAIRKDKTVVSYWDVRDTQFPSDD